MTFQAFIFSRTYRIIESSDAVDGGSEALIDHADATIWISPHLSRDRRVEVVAQAICRAWADQLLRLQDVG